MSVLCADSIQSAFALTRWGLSGIFSGPLASVVNPWLQVELSTIQISIDLTPSISESDYLEIGPVER